MVLSCAAFWYLLPRKGVVHPFVKNSDVGSMVTIGLMTSLTAGVGLLAAGLFG
jgi:hydrogenase/urease accessory protein HupE